MANLFQTQPYYPSVDSNQQAYNNWQNSLVQSANMAQHLHPETLAGMWGGTVLGAILGRNFYNYLHPKKNNGTITPGQQEQNRKNFNDLQNNLIQSQDYWQKQRNIPENQRTYKTPFGANFGRDIYNNFYNPKMPTEFTVEQMWNTPRTGENIADYANRVNPAFDWRKNIFGNFNFNTQPTQTATQTTPATTAPAMLSNYQLNNPYKKFSPFTPTVGFSNYQF